MHRDPSRTKIACDSSSLTAAESEGHFRQEAYEIPALARCAVETFVRERRTLPVDGAPDFLLQQRGACFVSIKTADGHLRGCVGTVEPARMTLAEEIVRNAIHAATQDPRFYPVKADELPWLRFSVDILTEPEPSRFEDLDPSAYGVIVEDKGGARRGLLLPDVEGVETAAQQVQIATRKAGISPGAPLRLYRFRVTRFRETEGQISSEQGA